jgi:integrase
MTWSPADQESGGGEGERSRATAKMKRDPVKGHPGVTLRTWTDRAGRTQRRYDATFWGPDRMEHSRAFRRLGDAEAWLEEERTNARRGGWIDPTRGNETLGAFYERWRRQAVEVGRPSERTLIAYDELWRLYIAPKLKDQSLNTITRSDVEHVVRGAAKRSAWRAQDALKVLRRLLSAAVDAEVIARNPATRVATPKIEQERPWVLTMEEIDALAEAVPGRYRALVLLAAYGSLRWSELVALRVDRLSPSRDRVRVEEKIVESGRLIRGEPKTKRSRRWVTVPDFVASALAEHVRKYPPGPDGLVFTAPQGGPIRRPAFYRLVWSKATRAVGLEGFPFRNLRHTGATLALQEGTNPVLVAFRLGHASTAMIERHYGDLGEGFDREIADRLSATRNKQGRGNRGLASLSSLATARRSRRRVRRDSPESS